MEINISTKTNSKAPHAIFDPTWMPLMLLQWCTCGGYGGERDVLFGWESHKQLQANIEFKDTMQ